MCVLIVFGVFSHRVLIMPALESRSLKRPTRKATRTIDQSAAKKQNAATAWAKKKAREDQQKKLKKLSKQLRTELISDLKRARESKVANEKRKAANELKSSVIQKISNIRAVKKMSPKQRRRARIFMQHEL